MPKIELHRIIVIDEKEQGKGYGKEFMSLIEKWLRLEGYKIFTESSPAALKFYQAINYVKCHLMIQMVMKAVLMILKWGSCYDY